MINILKLLFLVSSFFLFACEKEQAPVEKKEIIRPVKVQKIQLSGSESSLNQFSGKARHIRESLLSFRVSGVLTELKYKVGQQVNVRSLGAALDQRDFKTNVRGLINQLQSAQAQLAQMRKGARPEDLRIIESKLKSAQAAKRSTEAAVSGALTARETARSDFQRITQLYAKRAASKSQLDRSKVAMAQQETLHKQSLTQLEQAGQNITTAEKELEKAKAGAREEDILAQEANTRSLNEKVIQAKASLADTQLLIPFSGIISRKNVSNFEQITAGQPIYNLIDISKIEVQISLPETLISYIAKGQPVKINFLNFPSRQYEGRINKIGVTADQQTLTYPVFIEVENRDNKILPGMTAQVNLQTSPTETSYPSIPLHAVIQNKVTQAKYVWLYSPDSGTVTKQVVQIGSFQNDRVEIIEGLNNGDLLIVAGVHKIREGMKVRLLKQ
ncbi:MAG: hypothetical protein COB67_04440 [SAR324 cluster bacterium]|uniref:Uncharacterized protein n=1 Tax=SAR324 cluster bacterium TaxID=2024889 RepID=A0A2A4T8B6_9DELT|nr:MAG: hypothetical protein COB67_04440 [SAR324 cluster bacterium]